MANLNKVFLMGNLTRDPELKHLPSGTVVVEIGVAVNRQWTDRNSGERRDATTYVDCKSLGRQAEVINEYFTKGKPIFIEGRLEYRSWEAKDGTKRNKLEVFIENFQFVGGGRGEGTGAAGGGRSPAAASEGFSRDEGPPAEAYGDDDVPF
jgi:single-strand DNA-binding protein